MSEENRKKVTITAADAEAYIRARREELELIERDKKLSAEIEGRDGEQVERDRRAVEFSQKAAQERAQEASAQQEAAQSQGQGPGQSQGR